MKTKEKTISASEFKAKCLRILDHLGPQGVVITKRGQPVARVIPFPKRPARIFTVAWLGRLSSGAISFPPAASGMLNLDTHIVVSLLNRTLTAVEYERVADEELGVF